jgi:hypothetical protein
MRDYLAQIAKLDRRTIHLKCARAFTNSFRVLEHAPNLYQRTVHLTFASRYHFPMNSNRATQPTEIPCGTRVSDPLHFIHERTASPAPRGSRAADRAFLIATLSRIEVSVTRSFKRRKYFLIATRMAFPDSTKLVIPMPEFAKINRDTDLVELLVSHSKQRPDRQINRDISGASLASRRASRITSHKLPLTNTLSSPLPISAVSLCRCIA